MAENGPVRRTLAQARDQSPQLIAGVALMAAAVGYEAGSVLAGEPLELLWLVPVFIGGGLMVSAHFDEST